MLGSEFENYFNFFVDFKKYFLGVFSIDTLPKRIKQNYFCICNTSPSNTEGQHWFCILKIHRNHLELFDSLGVNDEKEKFYKQNLTLVKDKFLTFNVSQFQPSTSQNCGFFCIYFLFERFHNLDLEFDEILEESFDSSCNINDEKVTKFCSDLLKSTWQQK
jgi:hypothetical protein